MATVRIVQIQIGTGNRFDPGGLGDFEELDQGKQIAVVGDCHRRHAQGHTARYQLLQADGGVGQRELAVQVAMDESRGHGYSRGSGSSLDRYRHENKA